MFKLLGNLRQCQKCVSVSAQVRPASTKLNPDCLQFTDYKMGDTASDDKLLLLPYTHLQELPGKNTRIKMIYGYNHWFNIPEKKVLEIEELSEIIHNYDMLIDDMEDDAPLRREVPVAHAIYGLANTINSANFAIILALQKSLSLGHPKATQIYIEQLLELHRGQGMEMYWRDNYIIPSEEQWLKMSVQKNAGMIMLPYRLMQLFSDNKRDYSDIFPNLTMYIQIKDDYTDLVSEDPLEIKSFCQDVQEGKYAFPILHSLHQEGGEKVFAIIRQKPRDDEMKKYCMSLLQKHGSFEYTLNTIKKLANIVKKRFADYGGNPIFDELFDDYAYLNKENAPKVTMRKPASEF